MFLAGIIVIFIIVALITSKNKIYFPNIRFGESELFVAKIICLMKKYACFNGNFYFKKEKLWKVYWFKSDMNWHSYPPKAEVRFLEEFLYLVSEDENNCFFS